jgi:hypothetical protein
VAVTIAPALLLPILLNGAAWSWQLSALGPEEAGP